jgi:hypothetical protein
MESEPTEGVTGTPDENRQPNQPEQGNETLDRAAKIRVMIEQHVLIFRRHINLLYGDGDQESADFILGVEFGMEDITRRIAEEIESLVLETSTLENALKIFEDWKEQIRRAIGFLEVSNSKRATKHEFLKQSGITAAVALQEISQKIADAVSEITRDLDATPIKRRKENAKPLGKREVQRRKQDKISKFREQTAKRYLYDFWRQHESLPYLASTLTILDIGIQDKLMINFSEDLDRVKLRILESVYGKMKRVQ